MLLTTDQDARRESEFKPTDRATDLVIVTVSACAFAFNRGSHYVLAETVKTRIVGAWARHFGAGARRCELLHTYHTSLRRVLFIFRSKIYDCL